MFQNPEYFNALVKKLDAVFKNVDEYGKIYEIDRAQAEMEIKLYSELKNKAALGESTARTYLINQYIKLLSTSFSGIDENSVHALVDFRDILKNHVQIIFEILLGLYDMSRLIEKYGFRIKITEEQIREAARGEENLIREKYGSFTARLKLIATMVYAREYGQDCIDTLQHHNINEIGIIDRNYVYIVHKGDKLFLEFLHFENSSVILNIQKKTTQNSVVGYDKHNPALVAAKNNASRITVAGFDVTPTEGDLYYNERIFNLRKISLEEMRDRYGTIDETIYEFLLLNQKGRGSYFITGSDMGVGKSTFLLSMMEKVPDQWGIGILDTQNELQARKKYAWKNIKTLIESPKRTISECFALMLKMARDIIIVGEITMPSEVAELINASLRLNAGVGATMHSLSPFEVVTNVRNLMMRTGMYNNADTAEADIARGLDLVIHLAKLPEGRIVVERIVEIVYVEQNIYVEPVADGTNRDKAANLLKMAQLALRKYLYNKNYRYNEIFRFERDTEQWRSVNLPSSEYFNKISRYVDKNEINACKEQLLHT